VVEKSLVLTYRDTMNTIFTELYRLKVY
jgi:hypothetical protein